MTIVGGAEELRAHTGAVGAKPVVADKWIWVFMSALFVLTTLAGFIPDSALVIADVQTGRRPALSPVLHLHAVLMGSWMLLLLAQTTTMATNRGALHRKLGLLSFALWPAIVATMVILVKLLWLRVASAPPGAVPPQAKTLLANVLLDQFREGLLFAVFIGWALLVRRTDAEAHKRLMILGTLMLLPAAIDRIAGQWLPAFLLDHYNQQYALLWLAPALAYDFHRHGRLHRVYVVGLGVQIPFAIANHFLQGSPWWLATAPKLMGVQGW